MKNKKELLYISLFSIVYFSSYLTRYIFSVTISEIIASGIATKAETGAAQTAMLITYGIGMLVSGIISDKFNVRHIIFTAAVSTSLLNVLFAFADSGPAFIIISAINGFVQSLFWPALVKIMAVTLSENGYANGCSAVTIAAYIATMVMYLYVPLCIKVSSYKLSFFISAIITLSVSVLWLILTRHMPGCIKRENIAEGHTQTKRFSFVSVAVSSGLIFIFVAIAMQGMLRDSVATWMPTFIIDTFDIQASGSILSSVLLPIFSCISIVAASMLEKAIKNEVKTSCIIFIIGIVCIFSLFFTINTAFAAIPLMALVAACMHGVNLMLIARIPGHFSHSGHMGTISGITNSFVYFGSALSTIGLAYLSDIIGWKYTVAVWGIIAITGLVFCIIALKKWTAFITK